LQIEKYTNGLTATSKHIAIRLTNRWLIKNRKDLKNVLIVNGQQHNNKPTIKHAISDQQNNNLTKKSGQKLTQAALG
jgi:hypothetical protein